MNKIGFKFSWEQGKVKRVRKPKVGEEIPMVIPGTGISHIFEITTKIEEMEKFMTTTGFIKMSKIKKTQYLYTYKFMITTLALIQPQPTCTSNINEYHLDINGFI